MALGRVGTSSLSNSLSVSSKNLSNSAVSKTIFGKRYKSVFAGQWNSVSVSSSVSDVVNYNNTGQTWRVHTITSNTTLSIKSSVLPFSLLMIGGGNTGGSAALDCCTPGNRAGGRGGDGGKYIVNTSISLTGDQAVTIGGAGGGNTLLGTLTTASGSSGGTGGNGAGGSGTSGFSGSGGVTSSISGSLVQYCGGGGGGAHCPSGDSSGYYGGGAGVGGGGAGATASGNCCATGGYGNGSAATSFGGGGGGGSVTSQQYPGAGGSGGAGYPGAIFLAYRIA